jgi:hypothetical protein
MRAPRALRTARAVRAVALPHAEGVVARSVYVAPVERVHAIAWWQYESEAKRCYALELLMRSLFAKVPFTPRDAVTRFASPNALR